MSKAKRYNRDKNGRFAAGAGGGVAGRAARLNSLTQALRKKGQTPAQMGDVAKRAAAATALSQAKSLGASGRYNKITNISASRRQSGKAYHDSPQRRQAISKVTQRLLNKSGI